MTKPLETLDLTFSQLPTKQQVSIAYMIMCKALGGYHTWSATLRPGRILKKYFKKINPNDANAFIDIVMSIKYFNVQSNGKVATWKVVAKERQPSKNSVRLKCKRLKRFVHPNLQIALQ